MRRRLDELNRPSPNLPVQRRAENAALVALDPRTGAVVALVGSPDYFDVSASGSSGVYPFIETLVPADTEEQ